MRFLLVWLVDCGFVDFPWPHWVGHELATVRARSALSNERADRARTVANSCPTQWGQGKSTNPQSTNQTRRNLMDPYEGHLVIFSDAGFSGNHQHIFRTMPYIGDDLNDQMSSFVVLSGVWRFYIDAGPRHDSLTGNKDGYG